MDHRRLAAEHAKQAEELLEQSRERGLIPAAKGARGSMASAHAALALYYQRLEQQPTDSQ